MCFIVKEKKKKKRKSLMDAALLHQISLEIVLKHRVQSKNLNAFTAIIPHVRIFCLIIAALCLQGCMLLHQLKIGQLCYVKHLFHTKLATLFVCAIPASASLHISWLRRH